MRSFGREGREHTGGVVDAFGWGQENLTGEICPQGFT